MSHSASHLGDQTDPAALRSAIAAANIPTLLLVLVQLTGDERWIEAPYRVIPARGVDDNDGGGLAPERQAEIRDAATVAILAWCEDQHVAIPHPSADQVLKMLRSATGEDIPDGYGPMIAHELASVTGHSPGVVKPVAVLPQAPDVLIVGGGISGVCAGIRLQEAGIPFTIIERKKVPGGCWVDNRYPAAAVDTPSHLYSYSFARHDWRRYFATRDQVEEYVDEVVENFGLRRHIQFDTEVVQARYDDVAQGWAVQIRHGGERLETLHPRIVISAVGVFNHPKIPPIRGLDRYDGIYFHTAEWPDDVDITGKRVAVVGNGASAMQVVPAIADKVRSLTIFQRSPHWIAPFDKFEKEIPDTVRLLLDSVPLYYAWYRVRQGWAFNDKLHAMIQRDPDWPHPERAMNAANDRFREGLTRYMVSELGEHQDLLAAVLPTYPPIGKRLLFDNGWYRTLCRDNVTLVNEGVGEVREGDKVVTESGAEYEVDVLVFATGFDIVPFISTFDVVGYGGRSLKEEWGEDDAKAYHGLAVPDFPNFFILYGPNTQTGHGGSLITSLEAQLNEIMSLIGHMIADKIGSIEVRRDAYDAYNARVDEAHANMVWAHPGVVTYYRNSRGRVVAPTPFRVVDFWAMTESANLDDYRCVPQTTPARQSRAGHPRGVPA